MHTETASVVVVVEVELILILMVIVMVLSIGTVPGAHALLQRRHWMGCGRQSAVVLAVQRESVFERQRVLVHFRVSTFPRWRDRQ